MLRLIIFTLFLSMTIGCEKTFQFAPDDWAFNPPQPVETDTCENPVEITEPAFVTAYHEITDDIFTERVVIVGTFSDTVPFGIPAAYGAILDSLWELYRPEYEYKSYVSSTDDRLLFTVIKGTNDREQFYLKAQIRYNGWKHYFGFGTQGYLFFGADYPAMKALAAELPSVDYVVFYKCTLDSLQENEVAIDILGYCKEGRWKADFRFNNFPISDSLFMAYQDAGWETVLHAPIQTFVVDFRGKKPRMDEVAAAAMTGKQVIVDF